MKLIDEYRDPILVKGLLNRITKIAAGISGQITIMEVCGSHTTAIGRFGIRDLMPANIRLVSGPGCPVCVTSIEDVDTALFLASQSQALFATFGDMLRVPGSNGASLQKLKASGADIRIILSAMDCIDLAYGNKDKEIILMGIGFETTAPTIASTVMESRERNLKNFSVFSVHKVIPPAIKLLINDPALNIDGFLCPGHVSTIIGTLPYQIIPDAGKAAVITGFEPVDILEGIFLILKQINEKKKCVAIQYGRGMNLEGNPKAMKILHSVFCEGDSTWRGLGNIPGSGLLLREKYGNFDALKRFDVPFIDSVENAACRCGDILRGIISPDHCSLFKSTCTPLNPVGPCMVSSEGTCSVYYKYH
jgi:hydrogenase expression/formation protein HypD